jgi:gliding motility-associated-like protein
VELSVFDGEGRLYIPDAFTPNGDGVNDCYRVFVPGDVTEFQFSVYNRFGERVFHATDRSHCWDGTYKGEPAELSTYFYYYEATSSVCGKVFRKGDMHLIR